MLEGTEVSNTTQATVAEFMDETPGGSWSIDGVQRSNLIDQQPQVELAKYLNRPVLIKTHTWAQSDTATTYASWNPWQLFFNSTPIKNKINNYGFINCTLKLKFVVNASPFYSGALAFTYRPCSGLVPDTIISDTGSGQLMGYSQRPKVWIFPQTCQGGEIELPFFYHKNWLSLTSSTDMANMGAITPVLYAQLNSANGTTGTSIVINVYAWAENVKLHAPTTTLAMQSSEFDYKPSQIASSVAAATSKLSRIPMIGPYMKATSVVASGISKIASSLGFTNVPNMDTVDAFRPTPFPQNSTCEVSIPMDRSSVDPKNELTIDPRTVGLSGQDELDVAYIAGRECYIGNAILSTSDAVDALTLVSRVTPAMMYQYDAASPIQYTPSGYLSELFQYWRGDMIFRFKFICTRFHKGRVRITFDPVGNISTTVPDYTTVFNEVVDIGSEQDLEVRVPYSQATTYLPISLETGNYNLNGVAITPSPAANGLLTMRVVNPLSGPLSNAGIYVMVFVRAAENIEFAAPGDRLIPSKTLATTYLQSSEVQYQIDPVRVIAGNSCTDGDPQRNNIHFGEKIVSLRPLIHRMAPQYTQRLTDINATKTCTAATLYSSRRLKYPGFNADAWTSANTILPGTAPYCFNKMGVHQLISLLFVGQRGSMNWQYNLESSITTPPSNVTFKRYSSTISTGSYNISDTTTSTTASGIAQFYNTKNLDPRSGVALTDQRNQPAMVMNFPLYSRFNFQFVNPATAILGSSVDGSDTDNIVFQAITQQTSSVDYNMRATVWASCGHDYNFFFFLNTPSLYNYTIPSAT